MKKALLILILTFNFALTMAQGNTIEFEILNIESDEGKMMIGLYDSAENWLKKSTRSHFGKIENGKCTVLFENIPDGTYAISSYHDENDNNELDTNFFGIPKEDTGSSNNAPARMGPPKWEDAKFELKGKSVKQTIKL